MVRSQLVHIIRDQGALVGFNRQYQRHEIIGRITFNVEFHAIQAPAQLAQIPGILLFGVTLILARMNGNAVNTEIDETLGIVDDVGVIPAPGITQQGNLVEVDAEAGSHIKSPERWMRTSPA